jgi:predicted PurR-regulated permease PerM
LISRKRSPVHQRRCVRDRLWLDEPAGPPLARGFSMVDQSPESLTPPAPPPDKGLILLVALATVGVFIIVLPFYGALMWAAILGLVFRPLHRALVRRLHGRRNLAAALTLLGVSLVVVLPLLAMGVSLAREAVQLAQAVQSGQIDVPGMLQKAFEALPSPVASMLAHFGIGDAAELRTRVEASASRVAQFFASHLLNLGQGTLNIVVELFVALYVAFFMLRDGDTLAASFWSALPLREADRHELRRRVVAVVRATVKGNLVVALVQGALGSLALVVLGIPGALLAGALMAVFSVLPAVGAALVWGPIAAYLLATGEVWPAIGLAAFGAIVIGMIDNLLRPILVGRDTRLPDWLVLVSTIGGIALIGLNGFVVGPLVATVFIAAWGLYTGRRQHDPRP